MVTESQNFLTTLLSHRFGQLLNSPHMQFSFQLNQKYPLCLYYLTDNMENGKTKKTHRVDRHHITYTQTIFAAIHKLINCKKDFLS